MKPNARQIEVVQELINIGVGRSAEVLNTMLQSHIRLTVPLVKVLDPVEFKAEIESLGQGSLAAIDQRFEGEFSGTAQLIFPSETASKLVTALTGDEGDLEDLDSIRAGTLCEIGNVVINGIMGSISNVLRMHFTYSVPNYMEGSAKDFAEPAGLSSGSTILLARTRFTVEKLEADGDIVLFFELGTFDNLLGALDSLAEDSGGAE